MRKKLAVLTFVFFCLTVFYAPALSVGGNVFHGSAPSMVKTQWFDIIFDEKSRDDAFKIASVADDYYVEIAKKLGTEPGLRFPVSVTKEVESLNGFFTPAPYNMIVLYDSFAVSPLDSYEDTITSVFYHELTHAVTLNYKSPFWNAMSFIGDFLTPAGISMTYFWIEGAAVLFESEGNGGRLKNPFFTQLVTQAKINEIAGVKKFPSWRDVTGARDITPGGTDRYAFGACFASYLKEKYGLEQYGLLWKNAGTSTSLSFVAGVFKKTYGISLSKAWKDFKDSIPVSDFSKAAQNSDFSSELAISDGFSKVSTFDIFCDEEGILKIAYFDSKASGIYIAEKNASGFKKSRRFTSVTGVERIAFSSDGKKLFVFRFVQKETAKLELLSFDIATGKHFVLQPENSGNPDNFPVVFDDGSEVVLKKAGLKWSLSVKKSILEEPFEIYFPDGIIPLRIHRAFSSDHKKIVSFSYGSFEAHNFSLTKTGFAEIFDSEDDSERCADFYLQNEENHFKNKAAGVSECAVKFMSGDELEVYAVFADFDSNPLYFTTLNLSDFTKAKIQAVVKTDEENLSEENENFPPSNDGKSFEVLPYSPMYHAFKGIFIPFGLVPLYSSTEASYSTAILGATFATSSPWLDNLLIFSAGYEPFEKCGGITVHLSSSDGSYSSSLQGTALFDGYGFMQSHEALSVTKNLWGGLVSRITAGFNGNFLYGKSEKKSAVVAEKIKKEADDSDSPVEYNYYEDEAIKKGVFSAVKANLYFTNVHKVSCKMNQVAGFYFQPFFDGKYNSYSYMSYSSSFDEKLKQATDGKIYEKYFNAGITAGLRIPFIAPLTLQATAFPEKDYLSAFSARALLLSYEIQKGIPAVSFFVNRFSLSLSYTGLVSYESGEYFDFTKTASLVSDVRKDDYSDSLTLRAMFSLTPNTGFAADPATQFGLGYAFIYRPNPEKKQSKIAYGLSMELAF